VAELAVRLGAVVLAALLAEGVRRADRAAAEGRFSRTLADGLWLGAWLGAALLLANLLGGPVSDFSVLAAASALAFAALAGAALSRLSAAGRAAVVAGASLLVVGRLAGFAALAMNLGVCLPAFALVRWVAPHRPRLAASLEAALFVALVAMLHRLRLHGVVAGLAAWGLFAFVSLRHVSFAVSSRRTPGTSLVQYLSYLLFFPTCIGAMEDFCEFRERNLEGPARFATAEALRTIVVGTLALEIAVRIDASMDRILETQGALAAWAEVVRLFVRSALAVTGLWALLEGGALLLGFRLRSNFRGVLVAESPSAFWHAWRGTMTRWLTLYIYLPLGGNRRNRTRNTAVAFAVSTAWHCAGTVMLQGERFAMAALAPVVTWGAISFAGVALHAATRTRFPPPARDPLATAALRAAKIGGTWLYGSFTVTLLDLSLADPARFVLFLRHITGLG
jgi:MBOAT membrane-bound O-acyltransferase family protein